LSDVFSPPQNVSTNVRFKLTITIKKVSIHVCANIETNISSVKKYIYVRFPIILTGKWEMKTPKKNFEMLYLDLLSFESRRDIQAEIENLLDNGFNRKQALRFLRGDN